ncbi:MAG: FabA/FabZ family ACP-dehydratase [Bacteroidota bacterium]
MLSTEEKIRSLLPYGPDFCFVEAFTSIDEAGAAGYYTFPKQSDYYDSHFPEQAITPGVLLIECMAQIGLVGLGMFLLNLHIEPKQVQIAFSESNVSFLKAVYPGERVKVVSEKVYFRLGKLKCTVLMYDEAEAIICRGQLSGMIIKAKAEV